MSKVKNVKTLSRKTIETASDEDVIGLFGLKE